MQPDSGQDPTAWLAAAREHLATTKSGASSVRIRCFHGQRTVELALKAVLLHHGLSFRTRTPWLNWSTSYRTLFPTKFLKPPD